MARVKGGPVTRKRRRRVLKAAKGYFGSKSVCFKVAKQQVMKAGVYAYRDRRQRKRNFRRLWIIRINAAVRPFGISYRQFICGLTACRVALNRQMISELAVCRPELFARLVELVKTHHN